MSKEDVEPMLKKVREAQETLRTFECLLLLLGASEKVRAAVLERTEVLEREESNG